MSNNSFNETADSASSTHIEQKLNQILEQQKSKINSLSSTAAETTAVRGSNFDEETDKLKSEIYNLRQQLTESEKKIATTAVAPAVNSVVSSAEGVADAIQADAIMAVKVKELESRLAEYEIIADDIAELSQLRADNLKLKEQISKIQTSGSAEPPSVEPSAVKKESSQDLSGQAMVDALFAEASGGTTESEPNVPENDKNLLNEFEKITQKKENE